MLGVVVKALWWMLEGERETGDVMFLCTVALNGSLAGQLDCKELEIQLEKLPSESFLAGQENDRTSQTCLRRKRQPRF